MFEVLRLSWVLSPKRHYQFVTCFSILFGASLDEIAAEYDKLGSLTKIKKEYQNQKYRNPLGTHELQYTWADTIIPRQDTPHILEALKSSLNSLYILLERKCARQDASMCSSGVKPVLCTILNVTAYTRVSLEKLILVEDIAGFKFK